MKKKEVIELLKRKKELGITYKEISNKTGYNEKYLIRLKEKIDDGIDISVHRSKGKKSPNFIYQSIKDDILNQYNSNIYHSKIEFYNKYIKPSNIKISYSLISKLIKDNYKEKREQILILKYFKINNIKYYVAFDYQSNKILAYIKSNYNNLLNWIKLLSYICNNYGIPQYLYDYGLFTHNHNYEDSVCSRLKINRMSQYNIMLEKNIRKIKKEIVDTMTKDEIIHLSTVQYRKIPITRTIFYLSKRVKTIASNTIQFKNKRYYIESNKLIKVLEPINIYYPYNCNEIIAEYNKKLYNVRLLQKVVSLKGRSKYY